MENIIENNKLIAEFMGGLYNNQSRLSLQSNEIWLPYHGVCNYKSDNGKSLNYHSSWDWLMPVLEKIRSIDNKAKEDFKIKLLHYQRNNKTIFDLSILESKEYIYNACIEFIKWYNENKQD